MCLFFLFGGQTGDGLGNKGQLVALLKTEKIDQRIHFARQNATKVIGMVRVTCQVELASQSLCNAQGAQNTVKIVAGEATGHQIQLNAHADLFHLGKDVDQFTLGEQIQAANVLGGADQTVAEVRKSGLVEGKIHGEQVVQALLKALFVCFGVLGKILGNTVVLQMQMVDGDDSKIKVAIEIVLRTYTYDPLGNLTAELGATNPVRYNYNPQVWYNNITFG